MNKDVPYIAFEAEQMRADRRDRRHVIIEIVLNRRVHPQRTRQIPSERPSDRWYAL